MLAHDDTADSITAIEQVIDLTLPMVSFIRDDYDTHAIETLTSLRDTLGTGRIYHITLSPLHYSAAEVAGGYFDRQYSLFFKHIKNLDLRVVFRTMHEMNGGRYPRSGEPENFKKAWIHVYELARDAGLDQRQILFDLSVNGRDMPPAG